MNFQAYRACGDRYGMLNAYPRSSNVRVSAVEFRLLGQKSSLAHCHPKALNFLTYSSAFCSQ